MHTSRNIEQLYRLLEYLVYNVHNIYCDLISMYDIE